MSKPKGLQDFWPNLGSGRINHGSKKGTGLFSRHFTIMLIPHDDQKPYKIQVNTFLLISSALALLLVLGGFLFLAMVYTGTEQSNMEKTLALSTTQASLDSVLDEVKELVKVHQVFQGSLTDTLKELEIESVARTSPVKSMGDLANILDVQELSDGEVRELIDIRRLSSSLSGSIQPLSEIGEVLKAQKRLLSDIPNFWPVGGGGGIITMEFGPNIHPFTNMWYIHKGIDIAGPIGLPILAAANGKVVEAVYDRASGYGNTIVLEHKYGFRTKYTHLNSIHVQPGQTVYQGQRIGLMGNTGISTGSHTHFELQLGTQVLDPTSFLKIHASFERWEGDRN